MPPEILVRNTELAQLARIVRSGLAAEPHFNTLGIDNVIAIKRDNSEIQYRACTVAPVERVAKADDTSENRTRRFVASDQSVDRMGDVITVKGWKHKNFARNPVACWAHDTYSPPIGIVSDFEKVLDAAIPQLKQSITYHTEDLNPFAETVLRLVDAGAVRAVSVGFIPLDGRKPTDEEREALKMPWWGYIYTEQDQLELSNCTVPANANCLPTKSLAAHERAAIVKAVRQLVDSGKLPEASAREFLGALSLSRRRSFPAKQVVVRSEPEAAAPAAPAVSSATPAPAAEAAPVGDVLAAVKTLGEQFEKLAVAVEANRSEIAALSARSQNTPAPAPEPTRASDPKAFFGKLFAEFGDNVKRGLNASA